MKKHPELLMAFVLMCVLAAWIIFLMIDRVYIGN